VLSRERRLALVAWLRERGVVAIEDDYDAEYRYDRAAVGALQGLAPEQIVYAGTTSKTLAPALRLGWLVVPDSLLEAVTDAKLVADRGASRVEEYAFADFLARGELDRHLRRMRARYRKQRDALVRALADELPEAVITGISAGLHATVQLPHGSDAEAIRQEAGRRRIMLNSMSDYRADPGSDSTTLMVGYGSVPEPAIVPGVREIAEAVRAVAAQAGGSR
jgi:GntR family transcriptional regulator/MocR family aminotransferase